MSEIRLGPEDNYPEGTIIRFALTPTVFVLDCADGESREFVAQAYRLVLTDTTNVTDVVETR